MVMSLHERSIFPPLNGPSKCSQRGGWFKPTNGNQIDVFVWIIDMFDTTVDGRNRFDIENNYPNFSCGFIYNKWLAGFLNHQQ